MLRYQKYSYVAAHEGQFKTKTQLISSYSELKKQSLSDTQKHYLELRKLSGSHDSLITVRDLENNSLNLAIMDEEKVAKVQFRMNQISVPCKIMFHKGVSEVLYDDLTKETLAYRKSQQNISKMEAQLKQEKASNKAWTVEIHQLHKQIA